MDNTNLLNLIGFILPPLIDLINARINNNQVRFWIALGICVILGTLINYRAGFGEDLLGNIAIIFAESQIIYKTYWEKSTAREKLYGEALEARNP